MAAAITSAQLEHRLVTGEAMIAATADPAEVRRLTDHWLDLLQKYVRAVDAERFPAERRAA